MHKMLEHLCADMAQLKSSATTVAEISSGTTTATAHQPNSSKKKKKKNPGSQPKPGTTWATPNITYSTQQTHQPRQVQGGPNPGSNDRGTIGNLPFAPPRGMCWQCGETGHVVRDCPLKNPTVVAAVDVAAQYGQGEVAGIGYSGNQGN